MTTDTIVEGRSAEEALAEQTDAIKGAEEHTEKIKRAAKMSDKEVLQKYRAFVSPTKPNTRILVRKGDVVRRPDQNSPSGFRDVSREDPEHPEKSDLWANFVQGVLVTDNPEIIAWCEAHPETCRDANLESTEFWYSVKRAQLTLANQDPSLPAGIDVDAALRGEGILGETSKRSFVSAAQAEAEAANVQR